MENGQNNYVINFYIFKILIFALQLIIVKLKILKSRTFKTSIQRILMRTSIVYLAQGLKYVVEMKLAPPTFAIQNYFFSKPNISLLLVSDIDHQIRSNS